MGQNYFNSLPLRRQRQELGTCRFMDAAEFANGTEKAKAYTIYLISGFPEQFVKGIGNDDYAHVTHTFGYHKYMYSNRFLQGICL